MFPALRASSVVRQQPAPYNTYMQPRTIAFAILILLSVAYGSRLPANAQPIDRVVKSDRNWSVVEQLPEEEEGKWYLPQSNFGRIFGYQAQISAFGEVPLLDWLSRVNPFERKASHFSREKEYAEATIIFRTKQKEEIRLRILVPHPKYYQMIDLRLIHAFSDLEPPAFHPKETETIETNGYMGQMFYHENGRISLLYKLTKKSLVEISSADSSMAKNILVIAKEIDFDRLERKLRT